MSMLTLHQLQLMKKEKVERCSFVLGKEVPVSSTKSFYRDLLTRYAGVQLKPLQQLKQFVTTMFQ